VAHAPMPSDPKPRRSERSLDPTPFERKHLGGIEQPIRIERALHPHLLSDVGGGELHAHQLALFDADAVLAGEAAA
jgi:hypothetical protein